MTSTQSYSIPDDSQGATLHDRGRPSPNTINPAMIPQALRDQRQWANWHGSKVIRNARTGNNGSSTNPSTWASFSQAYKADSTRLVYIFARDGGIVGIDVDNCRNPKTGEIDARAQAIMASFPDLYWEVSVSGTGIHGMGYGSLPEDIASRHPEGIGVKQHSGYFVMTGNPLPGHEMLGNFGDRLDPWYRENFAQPVDRPPVAPIILTMDDQEIIERLRRQKNGDEIGRLLDGDNTGYSDYSKPRGRLAFFACLYSNDPSQIARILRTANLFKDADSERERDRKAQHDAETAFANYTGARYDPNFGKSPQPPKEPATHVGASRDVDAMNCDDVRTQLKAAQGQIIQLQAQLAAKDTQIASQAKVIRYERGLRKGVETVLASTELQIGPRATLAALYLELAEQQARGREPAEYGHQIPAVWLARRNGLSTDAVGGHLRQLAAQGLIERRVENVSRGEDFVDLDTGEVVTLETPRKAGFINMQPEAIITNITDYRRQKDDPKHGGQQTPKPYCETHPNAGTVTHIITECAEPGCGAVLNHQRTEQEPTEIFGPNLAATGTDNEAQHVGSNLRTPEHGDLPSPYPRVVNPLDRGKSPCSESPPFRTPNRPYISPPSSTAEWLRANGFSD